MIPVFPRVKYENIIWFAEHVLDRDFSQKVQ